MLEIIPLRIMCFIRCFDVPSVFRNKEVAKMHGRWVGEIMYNRIPSQYMLHEIWCLRSLLNLL